MVSLPNCFNVRLAEIILEGPPAIITNDLINAFI